MCYKARMAWNLSTEWILPCDHLEYNSFHSPGDCTKLSKSIWWYYRKYVRQYNSLLLSYNSWLYQCGRGAGKNHCWFILHTYNIGRVMAHLIKLLWDKERKTFMKHISICCNLESQLQASTLATLIESWKHIFRRPQNCSFIDANFLNFFVG